MDPINLSLDIVNQDRLGGGPMTRGRKTGDRHEGGADLQALEKVCKDFESIFVYTLLKSMRKSLPKPEGSGINREIYTSIGDLELARFIAHGRGMGLGDLLYEQLKGKVR